MYVLGTNRLKLVQNGNENLPQLHSKTTIDLQLNVIAVRGGKSQNIFQFG